MQRKHQMLPAKQKPKPYLISSHRIIAIESRVNKTINLYSAYIEK